MPDGMDSTDALSMGVAGALAQQYAADQREFLPMLAKLLKDSMPGDVQLLETGIFKKKIRGVVLTHGDSRLTLEDPGNGYLEAGHTKVVRGIALKTDRLTVEEWLVMAGELLEEAASRNAASRAAMAKSLGLV